MSDKASGYPGPADPIWRHPVPGPVPYAAAAAREVVATFLAILELCKASRVRLAGTAEDCTVTCTGEKLDEDFEMTADTY